jgi:DNA-directed RNA polymerase II subunit RPB2
MDKNLTTGFDINGCFDIKNNPYIEEPWTIINSYFRNDHLNKIVRHQLESFNNFVGYQIIKTIEMFNPIHIKSDEDYDIKSGKYALEIFMTLDNFHLYRPQIHENNGAIKLMFPQEARLRNFTYSSAMTVDINIKYVIRTGDNLDNVKILHKTLSKIHIGRFPIMLKSNICVLNQYIHADHKQSGECKYDAGGYFIINGSEKTVLGQERAAENRVYCFKVPKNENKYIWRAEIKSVPDFKCISPKQINMMIQTKQNIFGNPICVQIPRIREPIPLFILFRALGVLSDKEICEYIVFDVNIQKYQPMLNFLKACIFDANKHLTQEDALKYVTTYVSFAPVFKSKATKKKEAAAAAEAEELRKKSEEISKNKDKQSIPMDVDDEDDADENLNENENDDDDDDEEDDDDDEIMDVDGEKDKESVKDSEEKTFALASAAIASAPIKKRQFAIDILANDLFPHCQSKKQKLFFLGYMANKLIQVALEWIKPDDRDSYLNKRVDCTGTSLNNLFRNYLNKLVKDMEKQVIKEINHGSWRSTEDYANIITFTNIYKIIKPTTVENGFKRALSTGDFSIKNTTSNKVGVAQVLNRLTYIATLSHLRRISTPIDKSGKLIPPRKLHCTSWGYICPAETPEGQSVGIVKNLAYMTHITIASNSTSLYEYIMPQVKNLEDDDITPELLHDNVKVFINGCWVGISLNPQELYEGLKEMKYKGIINVYTSIVFDYKKQEIRVCNDSGRLTRPLLRVKNNNLLLTKNILENLENGSLTWDDLLTTCKLPEAVLEYVDPEEHEYSSIAMEPKNILFKTPDESQYLVKKYTHCEIHPSTIFGLVASCIPFPDHNQSPRNTYQCAQAKQAMGIYATNFHQRMDKTAYVLTYPTRPLVDTRVMNIIKLQENPSGCNIHVAIMTHTGYNQEDSLLVNKGSIDRGLLQITITHLEKDEDKQKINGDEEIRCKPDPSKTKGMKFGNYNKVNSKGLIPENTLVENRDIIIAKVTPIKENRNDPTKVIKYEDGSKQYRTTEETYIDKNYVDRNGDGYNFAKVRLRSLRKPVIGDKFSSRHGQKGTVGNIIPEEDMPFTADGLRPDIIINPHAIPSRMTIGQLIEHQLGKLLVQLGLFGDGTSFGDLTVEQISAKLLQLGFECNGETLLYDGLTGEQFPCSVFMGPVFYQRLKHMVTDKQHSRSFGPMVNLTRQPAEGKSRDGGLRYGEMERDCMIAHGAARFNRGRLYDASDKYSVHICKKCGLIAAYNSKMKIHICKTCDNRTDFAYVEIPYACKLLFQELITMNVVPRVLTY